MITKLKITDYDIPPRNRDRQGGNPIATALYRGIYYRYGVEQKRGGYQGQVKFDVVNQCYWIQTGKYARPRVKAGALLHVWLSAWYHNKAVFPITICFTDDTAEVECADRDAFLSFWEVPHVTENAC